jgi:hypothetical protein
MLVAFEMSSTVLLYPDPDGDARGAYLYDRESSTVVLYRSNVSSVKLYLVLREWMLHAGNTYLPSTCNSFSSSYLTLHACMTGSFIHTYMHHIM